MKKIILKVESNVPDKELIWYIKKRLNLNIININIKEIVTTKEL